ncbi:MAG: ABC transporter ATP-binding protein [Deferribacteraceae bacterium]|nr:ABC transporter ATP-binding protein [Deferribacteraceae bacterium]
MFRINSLHVSYGGIMALDGVDCAVNEGEIVCLIGGNGAGKSTLLRAVSGLVKPAGGTIYFNNLNITNLPPYKIVPTGISHSPEGRKVFAALTVEENLIMGAYALSHIDYDVLRFIYDLFPRLKERRKQTAGTLSGGEQQMLAIGRSLMSKPKLLLLDEPSLGLAPLVSKEVFSHIKRINETQKISILLVEQNAAAALKLSHRGYVLEVGKVVLSGSSEELFDSPLLKESYLGKKR